jgi:hypothetical protein
MALFASDGQVRLVQPLPGGGFTDRVRFSAIPDVVPVLAWLQRHPPYLVVVTDRTGAEVTTVPGGGAGGSTRTVVGPDDEIERNAPGGWSQPRYQRRAEDSWQHNAATVAEVVTRELRDLPTTLLLVAGDVRAVQLLRDHLPPLVRRRLTPRHLPGGRSRDGSADVRRAAIRAAVDGYVADTTLAALDRFHDSDPHHVVEGIPATLAALAAGRVGTLFVADDPGDERTAWFGPDVLCAADRHAITGTVVRGRLVDVAVRAALRTDAEVRVVDVAAGRFTDGIGGLCRFADR